MIRFSQSWAQPWLRVGVLATSLLVIPQDLGAQALTAEPYVFGVSDIITVSLWKNPDLSASVPVRPDGMITLPLVGEVDIIGKTPAMVQELLTERYRQFVTAPTVSVVVNTINSRRVFVIGEVASSGEYDILQPTRLLQVLAKAGGLTDYAKKDRVIVIRAAEPIDQRIVLSIKAIESGKNLADNILLQPGDTVVVP